MSNNQTPGAARPQTTPQPTTPQPTTPQPMTPETGEGHLPTSTSEAKTRAAKAAGNDRLFSTGSHVVLTMWALIVVLPVLWTLMTSFKTTREIFASPFSWPRSFNVSNYYTAWETAGIGKYFLNTIIVVGSALFLVMLLGAMCAYVLARFEFFGARVIYYLLIAGLTLPVFLAIVPLFFILEQLGIRDTLFGLIMTYVGFALPFTVFFLYSFFRTLPYEISEAAAIDGAGEWRTFFSIMLPMAKPGLASVAIMNFLGLWNQFVLPVALNTNQKNYVLSQGLARFASDAGYAVDFGAMFAAVVITVAPVLAMYLIFQRQLQGSVSQGTMK